MSSRKPPARAPAARELELEAILAAIQLACKILLSLEGILKGLIKDAK